MEPASHIKGAASLGAIEFVAANGDRVSAKLPSVDGDFAKGLNGDIIDLVFVGDIDKAYLMQLVDKAESIVNRRVRYIIYSDNNAFLRSWNAQKKDPFLIWSSQTLEGS